MTISELKSFKKTKLKKKLKTIITWDRYDDCSLETILKTIDRYSEKTSPKHCLFMQNLNLTK
mgnify:FL=1|tara:strand:- start:448 stop:633 length:186 start_codon:yes stop_codon:yes gene_type:complete